MPATIQADRLCWAKDTLPAFFGSASLSAVRSLNGRAEALENVLTNAACTNDSYDTFSLIGEQVSAAEVEFLTRN